MTKYFHKELEKIKKMILSLGALAEEKVRLAIEAIQNRDADIAAEIIRRDTEIDDMEVEIEEECLKILALHQPVAVDLRFITAVIKINNDLERICDEAVNIAECVHKLAEYAEATTSFDFKEMEQITDSMLRMSLDALVRLDTDLAYKVTTLDDDVDQCYVLSYNLAVGAISSQPELAEYYLTNILISRHLERIADHATNIAEEVIYLIEGEIVRHAHAK